MMRMASIVMVVLCAGCASSSRIAELEQRVAQAETAASQYALRAQELQQERDALAAAQAAASAAGDRPLAGYMERTLVAFVENRPPNCTGGLCLRVRNERPNPVTEITVNGETVLVRPRPGRGAYLWPGEKAYIRLIRKGRYTIQGRTVDAIGTPDGRAVPIPGVAMEDCAWSGSIPNTSDIEQGFVDVAFDTASCRP